MFKIKISLKYRFGFFVIIAYNVSVMVINLINGILFIITLFILYNIKKLIIRNKRIFINLELLLGYG